MYMDNLTFRLTCAVTSSLNGVGIPDVCEACAWHGRRVQSLQMARET